MIIRKLKIFSQNVRKNSIITSSILESYTQFDVILIQEPPWSEIRKIPSAYNCEGEPLIGSCHHPNWIAFSRIPQDNNDFPRVISYVNIRLSSLCFLFCKDIFDHRDINIISFSNNGRCHFILNVYSDSSHTALKYLKDTEVNINNVLLMTGDFNIRDSLWDPSFPFHSSISDDLIMIADSFDLSLSVPTNPGPTRFSDTAGESNSVIDLMFLWWGGQHVLYYNTMMYSVQVQHKYRYNNKWNADIETVIFDIVKQVYYTTFGISHSNSIPRLKPLIKWTSNGLRWF